VTPSYDPDVSDPRDIRVRLLGPLRVERDGEETRIAARKDRALLGEIALRQRVARDEILALLWPESDEQRARDSLRHALWRIRGALGEDVILSEGDELRIGAFVDVDVRGFERACVSADAAGSAAAVALYRGDLAKELEGPEAEAERTRLRGLFADAGRRAAAARLTADDPAGAIAVARAVLRHDPYREDVHRVLYEAHARAGDRAALSAEHQRVTTLLRRELGIEPSAETRALYARLVTDEGGARPGSRARRPSAASASRLVGRGAEHRRVLELVVDAIDRKGRALLVMGEAGAGKTALVDEAARIARDHGFATIASCAAGAEGRLAFQMWRDALRPLAAEVAALPAPWPAVLGTLLPTVATETDAGAVAPQVERARLFEGVARFLSAIAVRAPVLVVLDDLQWGDVDSLHLLGYLARTLRGERIAFLTAARIGANADLDDLRAQLSSAGLLTELELGALDADAVRQLLEHASVAAATATWLAPRLTVWTAGNAFFVLEMVRALTEQGILRGGAAGLEWQGRHPADDEPLTAELPPSVGRAIAARLRVLPADARHLLGIASALGRRFEPAVLAAVASRDELAIVEALAPALAARVLREDADETKPALSFAHDLVREATHQQLPSVMRAAIHRRVALALEATRASSAVIAYHFTAASDATRAVEHWRRAAAAAEGSFAHNEALRLYSAALALLPPGAVAERVDILAAIGEVHLRRGVAPDAVGAWGDALAIVPPADVERRVGLGVKIAIACGRHYAQHPRAVEFAEGGIAHFEATRPESADMADALLALMGMHYRAARTDAVARIAGRVMDLCRRLALPRQEAAALSILAWSRYVAGDATYVPPRDDIERLVTRLGDDDEAAFLLLTLARPAQRRGEFALALDHALAARQIAMRVGSLRAEEAAMEVAEKALIRLGRWADAVALTEERMRVLPRSGSQDVVDPLVTRAYAQALSGDMDAARATAHELAAAIGPRTDETPEHLTTRGEAIGVYVLTGLTELLPRPLGTLPPRPRCRSCQHGWLAQAGPVAAVHGDPAAALGIAAELESVSAVSGFRTAQGFAPLMRSLALARQGRHAAAAAARAEAERLFEEIGDQMGLGLLALLARRSTVLSTATS
jgi:DNA-binding SARP family transcriptional activator